MPIAMWFRYTNTYDRNALDDSYLDEWRPSQRWDSLFGNGATNQRPIEIQSLLIVDPY